MKIGRNMRVPASVLALLAAGRQGFSIFADATIEAHQARQQQLLDANENLFAQADVEKRDLSTEEHTEVTNNNAEVERLGKQIQARQTTAAHRAAMSVSTGRQAAPDAIPGDDAPAFVAAQVAPAFRNAAATTVHAAPRVNAAGNHGFRMFGDFAQAVRAAAVTGGSQDQRLIRNAAATSFSQESVGQDGGYAVPPDFRADIMTRLFDQDSLLGRCDIQQTSGNSYTAPVDETTPWGTNGIKAYWGAEAATMTQTKPSLREVNLRLHKLSALVPVTEEQLADAPAIDGYLRSKTPEAMDWSISYALIWGTGAGEPLGIMNSAALVTQAAEGAQTTDTINATNIAKMLSRMPARSRNSAVWVIHPDAEPQLPLMSIANQPIYLPPGGYADAPLGRLLGRPVIPHQVASTVGDLGDLMLIDFQQYLAVKKAAGVMAQTSVHLWFDQDLVAFKFTFRLAGQPWWSNAQSPRSGSNTQSPFVVLAAR